MKTKIAAIIAVLVTAIILCTVVAAYSDYCKSYNLYDFGEERNILEVRSPQVEISLDGLNWTAMPENLSNETVVARYARILQEPPFILGDVTPDPTPETNLTPTPTPEINITPDPTPEINLTPTPTPEINITPDPTPEPIPTPTPTPEPTPEPIVMEPVSNLRIEKGLFVAVRWDKIPEAVNYEITHRYKGRSWTVETVYPGQTYGRPPVGEHNFSVSWTNEKGEKSPISSITERIYRVEVPGLGWIYV